MSGDNKDLATASALVIADYQAVYADPIAVLAGESVLFEGREDNW